MGTHRGHTVIRPEDRSGLTNAKPHRHLFALRIKARKLQVQPLPIGRHNETVAGHDDSRGGLLDTQTGAAGEDQREGEDYATPANSHSSSAQ